MERLEDIANNEVLTDMIGEEYHLTTTQGRGYGVLPLLVAQIYEGQISESLRDLLVEKCSFVDTDISLAEILVSTGSIDEIISELEQDEADEGGFHYSLLKEVQSLREIMGKNYSYLHITRILSLKIINHV